MASKHDSKSKTDKQLNQGSNNVKSELTRLFIVLIVIFAIVGSYILYLAWPLMTGTTVVLDTRPVDPFDLLRGQYFVINYDIGSLPNVMRAGIGSTVYVSLVEHTDGIWNSSSISFEKPDGVFIKGKVTDTFSGTMRVQYGIEQYFFERGAYLPNSDITVKAKVDSSGNARILQLLHKGEPLKIEYRKATITS